MIAARQQCEPCDVSPVTSSVSSARASCHCRKWACPLVPGLQIVASSVLFPGPLFSNRKPVSPHSKLIEFLTHTNCLAPNSYPDAPSSCCQWKWHFGGKNKEGNQEGDDRAGVGVKGMAMGEVHSCRVLLIGWERRLGWL